MDQDLKFALRAFVFAWVALSFLIGAFSAHDARLVGRTGCVYQTLGAVINPGYVIGCELFRKRFEFGAGK